MDKVFRNLSFLVLVVVFAACGSSSPSSPGPVAPGPGNGTVSSVVVTPSNPAMATGATQQMSAEARNSAGSAVPGVSFTWNSSNPAVATVSSGGLVTALAPGQTTITATGSGVSGTTQVTVTNQTPQPSNILNAAFGVLKDGPRYGWVLAISIRSGESIAQNTNFVVEGPNALRFTATARTNIVGPSTFFFFDSTQQLFSGNYRITGIVSNQERSVTVTVDADQELAAPVVSSGFVARNTASAAWNPVAGASSYLVWLVSSDQLLYGQEQTAATSINFGSLNLPAGTYRLWVFSFNLDISRRFSEIAGKQLNSGRGLSNPVTIP